MSNFPETMCDVETLGLSPDLSPIIQIAAVRFNLEELTIDVDDMFNVSLEVPDSRHADPSTLDWWSRQKPGVLDNILAQAIAPEQAMQQFFDWSCKGGAGRFWSKPSHFDHNFVSSYFREFGFTNPFHFRIATDQGSWLRGRYWPEEVPVVEVPSMGDVHNALADCLSQIATLFVHMEKLDV
jgi:hypothetical protein